MSPFLPDHMIVWKKKKKRSQANECQMKRELWKGWVKIWNVPNDSSDNDLLRGRRNGHIEADRDVRWSCHPRERPIWQRRASFRPLLVVLSSGWSVYVITVSYLRRCHWEVFLLTLGDAASTPIKKRYRQTFYTFKVMCIGFWQSACPYRALLHHERHLTPAAPEAH